MKEISIVLSGGGARAAYQVGALKALEPWVRNEKLTVSVIIGSSIGAVNGLVLAAGLKESFSYSVEQLENLWNERTFRNTFQGHPTMAFFRAINLAISQWISPGPKPSRKSLFSPDPLRDRLDSFIQQHGGLAPENRHKDLHSLGVMTTIEGPSRSPLLLLSSATSPDPIKLKGATFEVSEIKELDASHGLASAALPSILPPVELDYNESMIHLVDGGISQNVPVDPAARLGGDSLAVIDISGRDWWHDRSGEPHDTRPSWEVPSLPNTFCLTPQGLTVLRCQSALGPLLRDSVSGNRRKFMRAVGPVWPLYSLLKNRMGSDVAFEVMSYVALDPDYSAALIERGFEEASQIIRERNSSS